MYSSLTPQLTVKNIYYVEHVIVISQTYYKNTIGDVFLGFVQDGLLWTEFSGLASVGVSPSRSPWGHLPRGTPLGKLGVNIKQ